jgi:hypothetical protein
MTHTDKASWILEIILSLGQQGFGRTMNMRRWVAHRSGVKETPPGNRRGNRADAYRIRIQATEEIGSFGIRHISYAVKNDAFQLIDLNFGEISSWISIASTSSQQT